MTLGRQAIGAAAEQVVVRFLEANGLQIVATNLRVGYLELDIVARDGVVVVVVEVRTRAPGSWTRAFGSIDGLKRRRIRHAAERLWNRRYKHDPSVERLRFDVASVTWNGSDAVVEYVKAAF